MVTTERKARVPATAMAVVDKKKAARRYRALIKAEQDAWQSLEDTEDRFHNLGGYSGDIRKAEDAWHDARAAITYFEQGIRQLDGEEAVEEIRRMAG